MIKVIVEFYNDKHPLGSKDNTRLHLGARDEEHAKKIIEDSKKFFSESMFGWKVNTKIIRND